MKPYWTIKLAATPTRWAIRMPTDSADSAEVMSGSPMRSHRDPLNSTVRVALHGITAIVNEFKAMGWKTGEWRLEIFVATQEVAEVISTGFSRSMITGALATEALSYLKEFGEYAVTAKTKGTPCHDEAK